jgi:hypothetical protein
MSEQSFADKRKLPRFALIAEAEVAERRRGGSRLRVRISELSAGGCYVDTLNPLPTSTEVLLRIEHGGVACVLPGTVLYVHEGLGMGVRFGEVPAAQRAILDGWLAQMAESSHE